MNFVKVCKSRIANENSISAGQIYLKEQSKLINKLGDMQLVAASIPQLIDMAGGLYKHKAKLIPQVPKSPVEIELKGEWGLCEDKIRKFVLFQSLTMIIFC